MRKPGMGERTVRNGSVLAVLLLATTACSPYGYRAPATNFATAVTDLTDAAARGTVAVEADRIDLLRVRLRDGDVRATTLSAACSSAPASPPQPCELTRFPARTTAEGVTADAPWQTGTTAAASLRSLTAYAASLGALTNAADREAFDKASAELAGSLGGLATASGVGAPIAAPVQAVAGAALWLVGQGLDHERYTRLRAAVRDAHPHVEALAVPVADELQRLHRRRISLLSSSARALNDGIPATPAGPARVARFDDTARAVANLVAVRGADASQLRRRLVDAHRTLRDLLEDPASQLTDALAAAQQFADQAAKLRAALGSRPNT